MKQEMMSLVKNKNEKKEKKVMNDVRTVQF